jgi:REP element-mobilizing transposase RayT
MPDHVHAAVRLHQTVSVSKLAQELKGGSSYEMGAVQRRTSRRLSWQEGYGAFSFGERELATVIRYIRTQRERHARNGSLVWGWEVAETDTTAVG